MEGLFTELKKRNVYKVSVIYAVVAWAIIQVADVILPALLLPDIAITFLTVLLLLGFPVSLILAWMFETGPQGISLDQRDSVEETSKTQNRVILTVGLSLIVSAVCLYSTYLFYPAMFDVFEANLNIVSENDSSDVSEDRLVTKTLINLGYPLADIGSGIRSTFDISSDGAVVVYTSAQEGGKSLLGRDMRSLEPWRILDIDYPYIAMPVISPNNQQVLFRLVTGLYIAPIKGGAPRLLTNEQLNSGAAYDWLSDEEIVFVHRDGSIRRKLTNGFDSIIIPNDDPVPNEYRSLYVAPDREHLLYTSRTDSTGPTKIAVLNLVEGTQSDLIFDGYNPVLTGMGHIVFIRAGDIWAAPVDDSLLKLTGSPVLVESGVQSHSRFTLASYSLSSSGRLVYLPEEDAGESIPDLIPKIRKEGEDPRSLNIRPGPYSEIRISPDGNFVSMTVDSTGGSHDIWVYSFSDESFVKKTFDGTAFAALWTPDSEQLIYAAGDSDGYGVWRINADGASQAELLHEFDRRIVPQAIAPDGSELFYEYMLGTVDIGVLKLAPDIVSEPFISGEFHEYGPEPSPDGNWMAFSSSETGFVQSYVQPYRSSGGGRWQVSPIPGAEEILWSEDAQRIYFRGGANALLYSVEMNSSDNVSFSAAEVLFEDIQIHFSPDRSPYYAVMPKNSGILYLSSADTEKDNLPVLPAELVVADNWSYFLVGEIPVSTGAAVN